MRRNLITLAAAVLLALPAVAAPGLGERVYPATIEAGATGLESRYGRLTGGALDGADALKLEIERGFSTRFSGAIFTTLAREPGGPRQPVEVAVEGVAHLGRLGGVDFAAYGEFSEGIAAADGLEAKALFSRRRGGFDGRLNLIASKPLDGGPVAFGYAASADWRVAGDLRGGFAAFGDAGDPGRFLGRHEHYLGPVLKADIGHLPVPGEIEVEAGYLFALPGEARDRTDGQVRLLLEWEHRF